MFQQLMRARDFEEHFTIIICLKTSYVWISEWPKIGSDGMALVSKDGGNVGRKIPVQAYTWENVGGGGSHSH